MADKIYRPEIDGLRAIAVLSVLFYHYGVPAFSGGFIGVDIFFVISGYLISKIIIEKIESNTFSFYEFYAKRARRILPAFFIVSIVSLLSASLIFHAIENERTFQSFNAALLFYSNIFFYIKLNYFSPKTHEMLFLHFWSLSVEEQFYFIFPGLIFICHKLGSKIYLINLIVVLFLLSIIFAQYTVYINQAAAFYLPMSRAWELLTGTIIFLIIQKKIYIQKNVAFIFLFIGLFLIFLSIFSLSDKSIFPGFSALPACIGTALIIFSGGNKNLVLNKFLCHPLLIFTGKISYSLYLVHWPIYIFLIRLWPYAEPFKTRSLAAISSYVVSILSYRFIETTTRHSSFFKKSKNTLYLSLILISSCYLLTLYFENYYKRQSEESLGVYKSEASPFSSNIDIEVVKNNKFSDTKEILIEDENNKFKTEALKSIEKIDLSRVAAANYYDSFLKYSKPEQFGGDCFLNLGENISSFNKEGNCIPKNTSKLVVIWGDSGVAQYSQPLKSKFLTSGYQMAQFTYSACPPMLEYETKYRVYCKDFNKFTLEKIIELKPSIVVIGSAWAVDPEMIIRYFDNTLNALEREGISVVILGAGPVFKVAVPTIMADRAKNGDENTSSEKQQIIENSINLVNGAILRVSSNHEKVKFINLFNIVCLSDKCLLAENGYPYFYDHYHTTDVGANYHVNKFFPIIFGR